MGISLNPSTILSGQGIDVASLVQQIITNQSTGPLSVWQGQDTALSTQNGLLDGIENNLTVLQAAVAALSDPTGALTAQAATSSQPAVLTATADSTAVAGTHTVEVDTLATNGTLYTNPVAAGANTSFLVTGQTGDIKLQVGGATPFDIPITQGSNDTLTTLASYINTQSSANNWGVTASVVSDTTGSRLSLQSQNTGTAGALTISSNTNTSLTFATPAGGTNASLTVDGVPFSSTTNTVKGAIQGVTFSLVSQSPGNPVQLSVGPDQNQITTAVNNFISAYNTVVTTNNQQYAVDPTGTTPAPPLESNLSLRSVQSSLLADAGFSINGNSGYVNLESLGINTNDDGTLTLGTNAKGLTFAQVLAANPTVVQNFFQNASGTGFANNFNTDLSNITNATSGPLNAEVTQNEAEQQDLTTTINNFEVQLTAQSTQLTQQYDAVNASLQAYPLLLQEITQTLGTLGQGTSSSGSLVPSGPTLTSGL
jgi:flagellar hook-associated protein 2